MANQPKKYTKFVATAATATLVASAIVPVASAAGFSDVSETNSHAENINALVEAGIIQGYPDGTFKPNQELTRGQVVKMLGKWVEAQGFEIPADYATKARFTDVAVDAKDQELVKYAALVADTKVFNGSNGELNASGKITRENMALVLDRAFTAINEVSLVELAAKIEDVKVADLATAKAEAREEIQALRDLGISVVENFNPKNTVTRGQFASFLNKTINTEANVELTVKSAVATSATTVEVVLSDDTKHTVKLEKALEANKATEITFTINEKEYKATVTYVVTELTVASAQAIDAGTVQVKFNTEVKESSVVTTNDTVSMAFKLVEDAASATSVDLTNAKAELLEDGKTLNIYVGKALEGNYKLSIDKDKVVTKDGKIALAATESKFNIVDKTRASIVDVKNSSKYVFEINVSEPVTAASLTGITAKLADGNSVISGTPTLTNNNKTIVVTVKNDDKQVEAGKDITVVIPSLTDFAGNVSVPLTQTVKVSNADITEPTLVSATATSNKKIELTFDEAISTMDVAKVKFNGQAVSSVEVKATDKTKAIVTLATAQDTAAYLVLEADAATDLSGNKSVKTSKLVTFIGDKVEPTIVSNSVKKINNNDYLVVKFSEEVSVNGAEALAFKYKDQYGVEKTVDLTTPDVAAISGTDNTEFKINLSSLNLKEGTAYSVEFAKGYFVDTFANELVKTTVNFTFNPTHTDATKKLVATVAAKDGVDKKGRYVTVNFDKAVDAASAETASNYAVEGATVTSAKLVENNTNGAEVRVYLQEGTVELSGKYDVTVQNVKGYTTTIATMDTLVSGVYLTENVAAAVKELTLVFNTNTTATLTFTEALAADNTDTDYVLYVDGKKSTTTVKTAVNGSDVIVTIGTDLSADIAAGKVVVLKATEAFDIKDKNENYASTMDVVLK